MDETHYHRIPNPPRETNAATTLVRLVDGLGFRYRWATESLGSRDFKYRPGPDSKSLEEILQHLFNIAKSLQIFFQATGPNPKAPESLDELRLQTLELIVGVRVALLGMNDADVAKLSEKRPDGKTASFWNMVNGPIADMLTHVGQINAWRRLSGNPTPKANLFYGTPPGE